jgi:hypothetical protein
VQVGGLGEEAEQQRHAQVGHGEVLQQQLRLARPQGAVEGGQHLQVEQG